MINIEIYSELNSSESLIINYLKSVDCDFGVPLSQKVDLCDYARKLLSKGKIIVAKEQNVILGLIGFYCNDNKNYIANISILSTLQKYRGLGIARDLLLNAIEECKKHRMKIIRCNSVNTIAIHLYKSIGFKIYNIEPFDKEACKTFLEYHIL